MTLNSLIPLQVQGPDFSQAAKTIGQGVARRRDEKLAGIATQTEETGGPTPEAEDALARLAVSNPLAARITQQIGAHKDERVRNEFKNTLLSAGKEFIKVGAMGPDELERYVQIKLAEVDPESPDYQEWVELDGLNYADRQVEIAKDIFTNNKALDYLRVLEGTKTRPGPVTLAKDAELRDPVTGALLARNDDPNAPIENAIKLKELEIKELDAAINAGGLTVAEREAAVKEREAAVKELDAQLSRDKFDAEQRNGPKPEKVTDTQRAAKGFSVRMEKSSKIFNNLEDEGFNPATFLQSVGAVTNKTQSTKRQKYVQAAKDWMRAKLRKESGAVISEEEIENEWNTYFPVFGDSQEVIDQKREARLTAEEQMRIGSGALASPGPNGETPRASRPPPTPEQARSALQRRRGTPRG